MTTQEKVAGIIADQLCVGEASVTPTATLIEDLGADSLDMVELAMQIESKFGIEVSDTAVEKWVTVEDVVQSVGAA